MREISEKSREKKKIENSRKNVWKITWNYADGSKKDANWKEYFDYWDTEVIWKERFQLERKVMMKVIKERMRFPFPSNLHISDKTS